jgi:N-acetylglucosamine-6-sulfatase
MPFFLKSSFTAFLCCMIVCASSLGQAKSSKPKNIIFILADDHRYDAMGFMKKFSGLETPNLDQMAKEGVHVKNAFVSTALCSPSRASILTGMYAHSHTVVDNQAPLPKGLKFFPQYLQKAGYSTAFLGKWHIGDTDDMPQPGFNHWLSFKGQGEYYNSTINRNGKVEKCSENTYITDFLTDEAIGWMQKQDKNKPFFVYLSHKGIHAMFKPAQRHAGKYSQMPINYPSSMYLTQTPKSTVWGPKNQNESKLQHNIDGIPNWVKAQRESWHGVDYLYHGQLDFNAFYRQYCETMLSVDESVGKINEWLKANNLDENTLVIYMGDNGFSFGERGLIDKRHAYEESMRVPLLMKCPTTIQAGSSRDDIFMNVDIAPTLLHFAGLKVPSHIEGISYLNVLKGTAKGQRDKVFYEYYWEYAFPSTPTLFAIRTDKHKYIYNYGTWDTNELYDLEKDPDEVNNLIKEPSMQTLAKNLRKELFDWLEKTKGNQIPLKRPLNERTDHKYKGIF